MAVINIVLGCDDMRIFIFILEITYLTHGICLPHLPWGQDAVLFQKLLVLYISLTVQIQSLPCVTNHFGKELAIILLFIQPVTWAQHMPEARESWKVWRQLRNAHLLPISISWCFCQLSNWGVFNRSWIIPCLKHAPESSPIVPVCTMGSFQCAGPQMAKAAV